MNSQLATELTTAEETVMGMLAFNFDDYPSPIVRALDNKIDTNLIIKSTRPTEFLTGEMRYFSKRQQNCLVAMTYFRLAIKECDAGNLADAWQLLCKINYLIGLEDGREEPKLSPAARGRSEKSEWKQLQFAKLISKKRPTAGWKHERDAANYILDEAIALNSKLEVPLVEGGLATRMTEWMKKDGSAMRAAFLGIYINESE